MPKKLPFFKPSRNVLPAAAMFKVDDKKFLRTKAWRTLRALHLQSFPLCQNFDKCRRPADTVHHIKPRCEYPELRLDPDNLESYCCSCHSKITLAETRQKGLL